MTKKRIYVVKIMLPEPKLRLVRATNVNAALRHVADHLLYAELANQETLYELSALCGIRVEDTDEHPSTAEASDGDAAAPQSGEETAATTSRPDENAPPSLASGFAAVSPRAAEESGHLIERDIPPALDRRMKA